MKIGFIGLGVMGRPMAGHLIDAGHDLFLHRVKPASQFLLEKGGQALSNGREIASASDVVILMLPQSSDVEAVLFGPDGVAAGVRPGSLIMDMGSTSPIATQDFARRIEVLGCDYVDAPVSGGETGARKAALTIMTGGTQKAFQRALPVLQCLGKTITLVGDAGAGQTAKVANQIIVGLTIQAVAEALNFAHKAGVDPAKVREALMDGFASSRVLDVHGARMSEKAFDPGFRIWLHRKDLAMAVEAAQALNIPLPNTASTLQMMNAAIAMGHGDLDHSALILAMQTMSGPAPVTAHDAARMVEFHPA